MGELRYDLVSDDRGVLRPDADGVLVATSFLGSGEFATVTLRVRDLTPVNSTMVAVTLFYAAPLSLMSPAAQVAPVGGTAPLTLLTLTATGGFGALRFELAGDSEVVRVAADGVLVVTNFLADGETATITVRVRDSMEINNQVEVTVTLAFSASSGFVPAVPPKVDDGGTGGSFRGAVCGGG